MQGVLRGIGLDPATDYHPRDTFLRAELPEPKMNATPGHVKRAGD
jgi:hypothetical protein